jgi:hypothetical protein
LDNKKYLHQSELKFLIIKVAETASWDLGEPHEKFGLENRNKCTGNFYMATSAYHSSCYFVFLLWQSIGGVELL